MRACTIKHLNSRSALALIALFLAFPAAHAQSLSGQALVASDPRDIGQIIGDLLDNALRYSAAGGRVTVSATADAGGVRIEIADEGPGLPESELENVFHRFYRSSGDATEGSSLGLAVVRGIVQRLGGRVQLAIRGDRSGLIASVWLPTVHTAAH